MMEPTAPRLLTSWPSAIESEIPVSVEFEIKGKAYRFYNWAHLLRAIERKRIYDDWLADTVKQNEIKSKERWA